VIVAVAPALLNSKDMITGTLKVSSDQGHKATTGVCCTLSSHRKYERAVFVVCDLQQ
jgi:hypothetical protein